MGWKDAVIGVVSLGEVAANTLAPGQTPLSQGNGLSSGQLQSQYATQQEREISDIADKGKLGQQSDRTEQPEYRHWWET